MPNEAGFYSRITFMLPGNDIRARGCDDCHHRCLNASHRVIDTIMVLYMSSRFLPEVEDMFMGPVTRNDNSSEI